MGEIIKDVPRKTAGRRQNNSDQSDQYSFMGWCKENGISNRDVITYKALLEIPEDKFNQKIEEIRGSFKEPALN